MFINRVERSSSSRVRRQQPVAAWVLGFVLTATAISSSGRADTPGLTARPLQPRVTAGAPSGTRFSEMPAAQTGVVVENRYEDPRMWSERYHEFNVGAIGTGVTIGDYDNDGKPDLFVVSKVEPARLFRNLGEWKFEDVTERAGVADTSGEWKQGATFVDVNNDGRLDLYVCRFAAPNLLFMNLGDGTFREEAGARGLAVTDACGMAAFCDYDRDGWLDVYVQTNLLSSSAHADGQRDYLFHNNGDGTFANVTARAGLQGESQGHSATWWDFDEDGWPDLYVANDFGIADWLYRNQRDGTFSHVAGAVLPYTPLTAMGADLGDINNDGHLDFLVADMAPTTREKDQRGMADTRGQLKETAAQGADAPQFQRSALYVAAGRGAFLELAYLAGVAATDWTWSVRFEDLDNDGRLDLFVANGMNREQTNADLIHRMMVAETPIERVRLMKGAPILAEANLAFRNRGDLRFDEVGAAWGLNQRGVSFGAAFGDLDGDGDLDLVTTNFQNGPTVLRNDSQRGHSIEVALRGKTNRFGIGAMVRIETKAGTQVRPLTLARGYLSSSEPIVHFGLGDEERVRRLVVTWPNRQQQSYEDVAADHAYTVEELTTSGAPVAASAAAHIATVFSEATAGAASSVIAREEVLEGTVDQPLLPQRFNRRGPGLAVMPPDPQGRERVVLGGTSIDPARVFRIAADGTWSLATTLPPHSMNDGPPLVFDVDGDGADDLLLTGGGAALPAEEPEYQPRLFLGASGGGFTPAAAGTLPDFPVSVGAVAAADFDHDGDLDVFVGGRVTPGYFPETPASALWRNDGGRLVDATAAVAAELKTVGMVTSALWSDVDGDGWVDLLITTDWGGVKVFRNDEGRRLVDASAAWGFSAAGTGWWTSIASADFNHDGRLDYVVGNLGLNTPLRPSAERPHLLLAGDFAGNGQTQLVEAFYEGDRLFPRRSRRELGAKIPAILKRFPRNDSYAAATLDQVLPAAALASAKRFEVTEARSGVFLSGADGVRHFEPLPTLAQTAPLQGVVAADLDGDGHADIAAVQNSYAPPAPYGYYAGGVGVLLRGIGDGRFEAVAPEQSGVIVTGDAKALVLIDANGDGRPDLLATRNNAATLTLTNTAGPAARSGVAIRLVARGANRHGIGARVTLEVSGEPPQTAEISAGGGYASQSSASCYFSVPANTTEAQLRIRWPSGKTSTATVTSARPQLEFAEP